jgi:hypothetical protein
MNVSAGQWTELLANKLGTAPPNEEEQTKLLELASTAAHASERTAAPISCWLAARAGLEPAEAGRVAKELADELGARS